STRERELWRGSRGEEVAWRSSSDGFADFGAARLRLSKRREHPHTPSSIVDGECAENMVRVGLRWGLRWGLRLGIAAGSINDDTGLGKAAADDLGEQLVRLVDRRNRAEANAVDMDAVRAHSRDLDGAERVESALQAVGIVGLREGAGLDV